MCKVQTFKKWLEKNHVFISRKLSLNFFFQKFENNEFLYMYM